MSKFKAIGFTILSHLVSGYEFGKTGLKVQILWLVRFHICYEQIAFCDTRVWHNEYLVFSESLKENFSRVFIRTFRGFAVMLRVSDVEAFVLQLRQYAPHVQVRKLKDVNRSAIIGHKTPK